MKWEWIPGSNYYTDLVIKLWRFKIADPLVSHTALPNITNGKKKIAKTKNGEIEHWNFQMKINITDERFILDKNVIT